MASVTAFNDMMGQFLVELHKTFPEEKGIKKMLTSFDLLKTTNPRLVVDGFMSGMTPYAEQLSSRDERFFMEETKNVDFLKDLDFATLWGIMSVNTKEATWQYLQTLYMLGTTILSIPAETLTMIESLAKDCADKLENGDQEIDQDALMKMIGGMMGGLPKN
jgi:hypothetical protein|tara:strand:+ start:2922 stop:3407 length:486 start_codon:yes stop_codon:yes gene_type:complete